MENEPRDLFGVQLKRMTLDYPQSFRTLGEYIGSQLEKAGFSITNSPHSPEEMLSKVEQNESQIYLFGWHAENGDAGSFYDSFIHSKGVFNQGRYQNDQIDQWIEMSRSEMDAQVRLEILKKIAAELQKDLIGIPLFETSRVYAIQEDITWEPRLDGLILASEVK